MEDQPNSLKSPFTIREGAQLIRCSEDTLYKMIAAEEIKAIRLRRRIMIPAAEIERLLAGE